jgi:disulfide bond formation protein DsbB
MIGKLTRWSHHPLIWVTLIVFGVLMEAVALYYQYFLEELPCVLCIHVRLWVAAMILVGVGGLVTSVALPHSGARLANRFWHLLSLGTALGFLERSYRVFAVERGWALDSCGMGLGLPEWLSWLEADVWIPWLFEAQGSCGYTPNVLFLTMAEALLLAGIGLVVVAAVLMLASWMPAKGNR